MEREKPAGRSDELGMWLAAMKVRKLGYNASVLLARFCDQFACQRRTVPRVEQTLCGRDSAVEAAQEPLCASPIVCRSHRAAFSISVLKPTRDFLREAG